MQVLGQCKRFLSYGGLSNQPSIHFGCASVPISISRSVVIGSQLLLMLAAALSTVHKYAVSLKAIIFPVYTFLIVAIKLATYIDALSKIDKIDEIFDYLQAVVNKREFATMAATTLFPRPLTLSYTTTQDADCLPNRVPFTPNVIRSRCEL